MKYIYEHSIFLVLIRRGRISSFLKGKFILWLYCVEKYNVERREMEINILLPIILRLSGRISSGEEGKGHWKFGEENQDEGNYVH